MTTHTGRIQLLAKPGSEWYEEDPILLIGEIGLADVGSTIPVIKAGDNVRRWTQLPNLMSPVVAANDYVAGTVTTLPAGSSATVTIDNTVDPPTISFGIPRGATGPSNVLTVGTVTTTAPGSPAVVTITGTSPAQVINFSLPQGQQGPKGDKGDTGPAANLGQPSKTIGLAVKTGSGAFAMYADSAPALDVSITPTWSGAHTFSQPVTFNGGTSGVTWAAVGSKPAQGNWGSTDALSVVVGMLGWKNYGTSHVIFDASQGTSPSGGAVNNTTAQVPWSSTLPTLMGWNGSNTYGVRVDSCRRADSAASADSAPANGGTSSYATYLWSTSHPGTYYASHAWDGTYWYWTTNHGAGMRVSYADSAYSSVYAGNATNGNFNATGTITAAAFNSTSTRALKWETGKPTNVLDIVARLRPIFYKLIAEGDDAREQLGAVAEEVHAVCPQLSDGKTVAYDRFGVLAIAFLQEMFGGLNEPA